MGSGSSEVKGPDFKQGIPADALQPGLPLLGHFDDEAVLLIRQGADVFAIGATCTHYSGPLAEGMLVDDEIRCPWHHACFSVRTGEVRAAPALNPLPRWRVEQNNGVITVREKLPDQDPLHAHETVKTDVRKVVIIGGGAAGTATAEQLRKQGFTGDVLIVDADADAPYDRPNLSKDYLAGTAPEEWLPLRAPNFEAEHNIRRMLQTATHVDTGEQHVRLADGTTLSYDALVLAAGSIPLRPPIPGVEHEHVHVLRSLADCRALAARMREGTQVVIAGASFIGLEAAASLRQRGAAVTVVAPEEIPFERVLGKEIGASLKRLHESHGVQFRLGNTLQAIEQQHVVLSDGSSLPAEVVLLGIGVRPLVSLAEAAGLETDRGVLVNEFLETNVPRVYAAGDIARYRDVRSGQHVRIEHWVVAQRQGQAVAANILGKRRAFDSVPFFWTAHYDRTITYVGHATEFTDIELNGSPDDGDCSAAIMNGERMVAYVTIGRDHASLEAERKLEHWDTAMATATASPSRR